MKIIPTKKMAMCYLIIPALLTSLYLSLSLQRMGIPAEAVLKTVLLCVFLPGSVYTACLLGRYVVKHASNSSKTAYFALFFVSFPLSLLCGALLYPFLYVRNAAWLIQGKYPAASRNVSPAVLSGFSMLLVLAMILIPAKTLYDTMRMNSTHSTPEKAFESYYPGGTIIGMTADGDNRFILGKDRDGMRLCCLIVPEENEWKISEIMRRTKLDHAHYDTFEINVFQNTQSEKEIIVIEKFLYFNDEAEKLGQTPFDTVQSVFIVSEERNPLGTEYYYWTIVDYDQPGYAVTGW